MIRFLPLFALLAAGFAPVHAQAMSEQAVQTIPAGQQSQYTDPDEKEEQFSDAPRAAGVPSGHEQELLGSQNSNQPTYGFGSYSGYTGGGSPGSSSYYMSFGGGR